MTNAWFASELKTALDSLYDPTVLRNSPLVELLGVAQNHDATVGLRGALTESIESLRPGGNTPHESRAWRAYHILRRRYIEGLGQRQVASDLGLGVRQLQREEKLARELLAGHLWAVHGLKDKVPADAVAAPDDDHEPLDEPVEDPVAEELAWLRNSVPIQFTDLSELMQDVLRTVAPLTRKSDVGVTCRFSEGLHAPLRAAVLRQALLDIVSAAAGYVPGGRLVVDLQQLPAAVCILLKAYAGCQAAGVAPPAPPDSLAMAERLVQICDGAFEITTAEERISDPLLHFGARLLIPHVQQKLVLVIDDNADSLQLMQRYLAGSTYLYVGVQDPQRGMELAIQQRPDAILLDIMMPAQDGWSVLAQMREHLQTSHIPVVVCTLLSQRDLALTLGAAGFLRKPISRGELLATLDQLVAVAPSAP